MRELEIRPFSDEDVDGAAALLGKRHAQHREAEPLLPANVDFRAEIDALWRAEVRSGVHRTEGAWGSNVWVEHAGHAVEEPEFVRDLYALAAADWVKRGLTSHYASVPATDPKLVDAWFRLSFGAQHAGAIQETPATTDPAPPGIVVRRATRDDADAVVELDFTLPRHQELAPVFAPGPTSTKEEDREEFLEEVDDPELGLLVAELEGRVVGLVVMVPAEKSSMHSGVARPEHAALLTFAATIPEARGSGAGVALTNAGLAWARDQGYPVTLVDWRETNLLASRFWPRRGFRRTFLRLYRSIP
jgi:ribosomal protein S18 acetylase RimI-like enzyme